MKLRLNTFASHIDVAGQRLTDRTENGGEERVGNEELVVGTGLDQLGPEDRVHVIHSMGDTVALDRHLEDRNP